MKVIAGFLFVALWALLVGLMRCEVNNLTIDARSNQRASLFLCDYYVKHVRRPKLNGIESLKDSSKMIGRIRLSCDDALSIRRELLSIFKGVDQAESELIKSNYLTFDRPDMVKK